MVWLQGFGLELFSTRLVFFWEGFFGELVSPQNSGINCKTMKIFHFEKMSTMLTIEIEITS